MDISELLDGLNDKQREAVAAPMGNYLVLAGAGSGKTRVLTHRIAWLIAVEQVPESSIMAVTFTNKAAAEMRQRIELTLQQYGKQSSRAMWVGTFHSIAHRLLRAHHLDVNLPQDFQILDAEDQQRLLKRLLKQHNYDEKSYPPKQACWYINNKKDEGLRPHEIEPIGREESDWQRIYMLYQEVCDRAGLVDFAEILLKAYELFKNNELILSRYQHRFEHILIDEFQDTNKIQYAWIKLLAGQNSKVMIVGDDDQSIYGWRGAKIENIQRFLKDYNQAKTIRLEQNYRSTGNILMSANQLISHNHNRLGKNLWTNDSKGEPIGIYAAFNELDEAVFVTSQIKIWLEEGGQLDDCAILYRSNRQSRVLEEALLRESIPYRIYGGVRFFDRQEIKDALAYLRLIANRQDDAAFERIINTPARGVGERTLDILRNITREQGVTLWQAIHLSIQNNQLSGRAATSLTRFVELINVLHRDTAEMSLFEQTDYVIKHSGLYEMYKQEKGEKGEARIENLEELVSATREFVNPEEELNDLTAFLTHASLEAGETQAQAYQSCVEMMTLHSAKGLEFSRVFIVGVEEGIFPSTKSVEEPQGLEEERRLAYVGITRAKKKLTLSYAETRRLYGKDERHIPSRFISELPSECIQEIRLRGTVTRAYNKSAVGSAKNLLSQNNEWKMGQKVKHEKFGTGTVINIEGAENNTRLQIAFQNQGIKWLIASIAKLEKI